MKSGPRQLDGERANRRPTAALMARRISGAEEPQTTVLGHGFVLFFFPQRAAAPWRAISLFLFLVSVARPLRTFALPPSLPI